MNQTATRAPARQSLQRQPAPSNDVQRHVAQAQQNAAEAKKANALQQLASRLNVEPNGLKNTLMNTVFKVKTQSGWQTPTEEEFAALVIVANEYDLNPMTKQLYAFPAKGGGIVPVISVDGWIEIMNRHPAFDGIEFNDIPDEDGKLIAIESVIYRKDRNRPIRITEYLDECKRDTDPWRKSPARMLRHKSLIQCVRVAMGVSGHYDEDAAELSVAYDTVDGGAIRSQSPAPMRNVTPPARQLPQQDDEQYDPQTGEIVDEGRSEADQGEIHRDPQTGVEIDPQEAKANEILASAKSIETIVDYNKLAEEAQPHIDMFSDPAMAEACNNALKAAKNRLARK